MLCNRLIFMWCWPQPLRQIAEQIMTMSLEGKTTIKTWNELKLCFAFVVVWLLAGVGAPSTNVIECIPRMSRLFMAGSSVAFVACLRHIFVAFVLMGKIGCMRMGVIGRIPQHFCGRRFLVSIRTNSWWGEGGFYFLSLSLSLISHNSNIATPFQIAPCFQLRLLFTMRQLHFMLLPLQ